MISKRENLQQVEKATGKPHPDLQLPPIPAAVAHLWEWFREVQNGERLQWEEIRAWSTMTCKDISSIEAKAIRSLSFIQAQAIHSAP